MTKLGEELVELADTLLEAEWKKREALGLAHQRLYEEGLVRWTMGNISWRTGVDEVFIKPSGVPYASLNRDRMVMVNLDGEPYPGEAYKPSTDVFAHCAVYRALPLVTAIVHTHSTYATAFAAAQMDIPCILTSIADEFGGAIPCAPYARIGGEDIGTAIVATMKAIGRFCPAILLGGHGVFTFGNKPMDAVKAAVMVEDAAKTVYLARQLTLGGDIQPLPNEEIEVAHKRYKTAYGQRQ